MPKLYVCGEALIDFVPQSTADGTAYLALPGGSPLNIAKAAALAGGDAEFLGALSTDFFGDQLRADLHAHGVSTTLAPRPADPTTLAFVDMSTADPRYAFFDRQSASALWEPPVWDRAPAPGDMLCVGSISLVPTPGADNITRFAEARAAQMMLAIDPNVRPGIMGTNAAWRGRLDRLFAVATVVKLSTEDLAFLAPSVDQDTYTAQLLNLGVALVVVTGGAKGATGATPSGRAHVPTPQVTVADTVGAGDTFMGNLLVGLQRAGCASAADVADLSDAALQGLLAFAAWAAAINVTRTGCQPPRRAETDAALAAGRIG